jgi:arylsulfatase A-like enzyme
MRGRPLKLESVAMVAMWLWLWACSGGGGAPHQPPPEPDKVAAREAPNVLLITVDTLRADHLPIYGYHRNTAPQLSRLAAESALFEQAWSASPATDGSHASLFTGLHQSEHGKFGHRVRLADAAVTLAEQFRAEGYRTQGWASSVKFVVGSGFSQGFETWEAFYKVEKNERSALITQRVVQRIDQAGPEPWFAFAHYFDVHAPYAAPEPYASHYAEGEAPVKPAHTADFIQMVQRRKKNLPHAQLMALKAMYDGQILYQDQTLSPLWERLGVGSAVRPAANGRSTIVVLTSDHGEAFMENDYIGHGIYLHEAITRVPLLVWWPGRVPPGLRISQPTMGVDVFSTTLELAGLPVPPNSGQSFAPQLLQGQVQVSAERPLLLQSAQYWGVVQQTPRGLFKLTERQRRKGVEPLLVRIDEQRHSSLQMRQGYPEVEAQLRAQLEGHKSDEVRGRSVERTDIDAEEEELLKAIGYLD